MLREGAGGIGVMYIMCLGLRGLGRGQAVTVHGLFDVRPNGT